MSVTRNAQLIRFQTHGAAADCADTHGGVVIDSYVTDGYCVVLPQTATTRYIRSEPTPIEAVRARVNADGETLDRIS